MLVFEPLYSDDIAIPHGQTGLKIVVRADLEIRG
jgi:hypothetical protein